MTDRSVPPSFTPPGGNHRPPSADDAVTVTGQPGGRIPRRQELPDDAVANGSSPRVTRQSSREVPVRRDPVVPPRRTSSRPESFEPGAAAPRRDRSTPPSAPAPRRVGTTPGAAARGTAAGPARTNPDGTTPGARARAAAPRTIPPRQAGAPMPGAMPGAVPPAGSARAAAGAARPRPTAARPGAVDATRVAARPSTRPAGPAGPSRPGAGSAPAAGRPGRLRLRKRRLAALISVAVLVLVLAWPVGLLIWANGKINHVPALSGAADTPGTTFLLAGSDARGSGGIDDETTGARTDTILLLHKPASGPTALISLPRDSFVEIPGRQPNKLNAAYSFGGPQLLVKTVEKLTGLTVDHYVEIGFGGIADVVDAVGGVNLCSDLNVNDAKSGMVWTPGCHDVDGTAAIAFSRMRYSDPKGDIGRAERQRQLIGALSSKIADPGLVVHPGSQVSLIDAGLASLTVGEGTNIIDFGRLALAFRAANGPDGVTGTPWISNMDYRPGGVGSTIRLDVDRNAQLWAQLRDGTLKPGDVVGGMPGAS